MAIRLLVMGVLLLFLFGEYLGVIDTCTWPIIGDVWRCW